MLINTELQHLPYLFKGIKTLANGICFLNGSRNASFFGWHHILIKWPKESFLICNAIFQIKMSDMLNKSFRTIFCAKSVLQTYICGFNIDCLLIKHQLLYWLADAKRQRTIYCFASGITPIHCTLLVLSCSSQVTTFQKVNFSCKKKQPKLIEIVFCFMFKF